MDPAASAQAIRAEIAALPVRNTPALRGVRRRWSKALAKADGEAAFAVAAALHRTGPRWVAEELIRHHQAAFALVDEERLCALAAGLDGWGGVDAFGTILAGPAWARGQVPDALIWRWARSPDRWLRRTALVCTTALGGAPEDVERTLQLCAALAADRDDMVEKAMSWALRVLSAKDRAAVETFLDEHDERLPARVKREVNNKLRTGLKTPRARQGAMA
jgi:3-methyladenine DNA glycosylase AlkD